MLSRRCPKPCAWADFHCTTTDSASLRLEGDKPFYCDYCGKMLAKNGDETWIMIF